MISKSNQQIKSTMKEIKGLKELGIESTKNGKIRNEKPKKSNATIEFTIKEILAILKAGIEEYEPGFNKLTTKEQRHKLTRKDIPNLKGKTKGVAYDILDWCQPFPNRPLTTLEAWIYLDCHGRLEPVKYWVETIYPKDINSLLQFSNLWQKAIELPVGNYEIKKKEEMKIQFVLIKGFKYDLKKIINHYIVIIPKAIISLNLRGDGMTMSRRFKLENKKLITWLINQPMNEWLPLKMNIGVRGRKIYGWSETNG